MGTNTSTKLMAAGANLATTLATFSSFAYLFMYYKLKRKEIGKEISQTVNYKHEKVSKVIKMILAVSIPMTLSSVMSSLNKNIDSVTVSRMLQTYQGQTVKEATANYGILGGKVDTLTSLPLSINIAFATALVPAIAEAKIRKDMEAATKKTSFSLLLSMIIGLPCTIGMCMYSQQILNLIYPNANQGASILQICSFTIIFTILDQTINGALQGFGKVFVPAIALGCGCLTKLAFNLILLRIPGTGVYGAAVGSVACHMVAFTIAFNVLRKNVKLDLKFSDFIIKPVIATLIMAVCSYASFIFINKFVAEKLAFVVAILVACIVYTIAILALKVLKKEEICMLPQGNKIYNFLEKINIY
jgi:stage V sporulation protein B